MDRELDRRIAQEIFGFELVEVERAWSPDDWMSDNVVTEKNTMAIKVEEPSYFMPPYLVVPHFTEEAGDMWEVIEELTHSPYMYRLEVSSPMINNKMTDTVYEAVFSRAYGGGGTYIEEEYEGEGDTQLEAIARAALEAAQHPIESQVGKIKSRSELKNNG